MSRVDNFSQHKDEVDKILAEGVKKMGLSVNGARARLEPPPSRLK